MKIENTRTFLKLAKQSPAQAFEWLETLNISRDDLLASTINAGYSSYLSDFLTVKGFHVSSSTLQYALGKLDLSSLYKWHKKAGCKVNEGIEQEFNTRVLELVPIQREKNTRYQFLINLEKYPGNFSSIRMLSY